MKYMVFIERRGYTLKKNIALCGLFNFYVFDFIYSFLA